MNSSDRPMAFRGGIIKSRGIDVALLLVALALGISLNWGEFVADYLEIDEHVSYWITSKTSPSTLLDRSLNYSATPPLSFMLQRASLDVFGESEWALRLPGALSYVGTIVAVWLVGMRWLSPFAGGLAALLVAVHPSVLRVAVAARPYSVGLLIAVLAMHATLRLTERLCRWYHWLFWLLANLALVQTHYLFGGLVGAEWLILAWPAHDKSFTRRAFAGWSVVLCVLLTSALPGFLRVFERRDFLNWTTRRPELTDLTGLILPIESHAFRDPVWWCIVGVTVIWVVLAYRCRVAAPICAERRNVRRVLGRLAAMCVVPAGVVWLLARLEFESLAADRYLVIYVPAAALCVGGVLCQFRGRVAPILACSAILLLGGVGDRVNAVAAIPERFATGVVRPRYHRAADRKSLAWREAASIVGRSPTELILVGSGLTEMRLVPAYLDDAVFHDYVSCRLGRLYCTSANGRLAVAQRLSLPMLWTPDAMRYFRRVFDRLARGEHLRRANGTDIALVCARDTDLLRATEQQAIALIELAGAVEANRVTYEDVVVIFFAWPKLE
jgi:4-amino-4-deoxy-L-arabinose transferase-like glycosyltransferase